jgi:hypothetical protein
MYSPFYSYCQARLPSSDPPGQHQDDDDQQQDAEDAGRAVAPVAGMAPSRTGTDAADDEQDDQNDDDQ